MREPSLTAYAELVLSIEYMHPEALKPLPSNARIHSKRQIRQISDSMRTFGFVRPVLIDRNNQVIAGNGCLEAAKLLGYDRIPTVRLDKMSEAQIRAYAIADNKLAENSSFDKQLLAIELHNLLTIDCPEFDVSVTGFEVAEIDVILEEARSETETDDRLLEPNSQGIAVTEINDQWQLGRHRIRCGSALDEHDYMKLLRDRRAAMVFTDPPYNVEIDGHATGNGEVRHREFAMASGEMTELEFISFLHNALRLLALYSATNSLHYICMDWRHVDNLIAAGKQNYHRLLNLCVWVKDNPCMGSLYRSQHELVFVFRKGPGHRNNVQLGRFGRNRSNVWRYPGVQTQSRQGDEGNLLALHPTVKPIAMVADAILDCTARGDIVLDAFLGSGTTLMAAERVGRICYGIEIDPLYVDVAIRRWQNYTGEAAIHVSTGKRFDEIAKLKEVAGE